jgi:hypothetical protein
VVGIQDIFALKQTGLCIKNVTVNEIVTCITDSLIFLDKFKGEHYIECSDIYITIESGESEPFYTRGLLCMRFFSNKEDIQQNMYIGYLRFCPCVDKILIGNIQTSADRDRLTLLSRKKYKMSILRLMFKMCCLFFKVKNFNILQLASMSQRVICDVDADHKFKTDYDKLFSEFGCVLKNDRWEFNLK